MMTKVLTGVLSVGLLAVASGSVFAADSVDKQEVENKYFTQSEVQNGQTFYSYEYGDLEISSDRILTEEGIEQVKIDNSDAESSPDIPVDESFKGTIHKKNNDHLKKSHNIKSGSSH